MRKSQTTAFYFYFFIQENSYFFRKNIWKTQFILLYLLYRFFFCFVLLFFFMWQVIGNAVTPTPIQIFIDFPDAILRFKILDNKLDILTQILITMDYLFYLYISDILIWALNFIIKSIRKEIEILAKRLFSFSIIVFNIKFLVILFVIKSVC